MAEDNGFAEWGGYFEAKKSKLEEQFAAASDPFRKSNLFAGISIFVNGRTDPSADELKRIMMVHGGIYHHYERSHTNFIIASNLPDVKVRNMDTTKIISAQWVVDCVAKSRVLDYKPYLLYTNQKTTQPRLNFSKGKDKVKHDDDDLMPMAECRVSDTEILPLVPVQKPEVDLGGILKELQQAAVVVPPQKESLATKINNLSATSINQRARTAADPEFLGEFFKNSRLHHIATLGAGFKKYVCTMRKSHGDKPFAKRAELRSILPCNQVMSSDRYVMHIDMDCFFVSVGLRLHPELRGQPVVVTHSKGGNAATDVPVHPQADRQAEQELFAQRFEHHLHDNIRADKVRTGFEKKMSLSEIASCSYEARAKGIRNGMFVGRALELCPELKTIPYDFEGYREVAYALYDTVAQYTLNIEAVSCDEMFVELTDLVSELQVNVMDFVGYLREEVFSKTGCPCSAGVGANKLLSRMATKQAKPNGQFLLDPDGDILSYMAPTALESLPGIGSSISYKLKQAGLNNCGDVQKTSVEQLETVLGKKMAGTLHQNCRGIDPRPLLYEQHRKSLSAEVNYGIRFTMASECESFVRQLTIEVQTRLMEIKRTTKSITLKLMVRAPKAPIEASKFMGHGVCDTWTKSALLKTGTADVTIIIDQVLSLLKLSKIPPNELRGIGIHLNKLERLNEMKQENVLKQMFNKISEKKKDTQAEKPAITTFQETDQQPKKQEKPELLIENTKPKVKQGVNVLNMLKSAAAASKSTGREASIPFASVDDTVVPSPPVANPDDGQFDPEVLAQLPEDLRREVLAFKEEYLSMANRDTIQEGRNLKKRTQSPTPPSSPPFTKMRNLLPDPTLSPLTSSDLLPSTSKAARAKELKRAKRKEMEAACHTSHQFEYIPIDVNPGTNPDNVETLLPAPTTPPHSPPTPLELLNRDYKTMFANWVNNEVVPKPTDINIMHEQICDLVKADKLHLVFEVMKYFCWLIKTKRSNSCDWHLAYNYIEVDLQELMLSINGHNLYLPETIKCSHCGAL
ncbi:DNA repair protein Rev1 [Drosophila tropicalis]|uniref:DNA repair protein Rev1 n=1 Tax=Drosophila tropicalis TaxID=46794 RepID=UPI0035ABB8BE